MLIRLPLCSFSQLLSVIQAVQHVKANAKAKFDETIDFQLKLNVDPKHGDQAVRGNCIMPGGLGRKFILAVLTPNSLSEAAQRAGADVVGAELLLNQIKDNNYTFDKLMATSDMMAHLKPFARALGPKGLMPNLKAGTLVTPEQLIESIKSAKAGSIEFRVDSGRNLMVPVGKVSFQEEAILKNIKSFAHALSERRPATIKGKQSLEQGALIKAAAMKSTMGKPVLVEVNSFDPKSKDNLLKDIVI